MKKSNYIDGDKMPNSIVQEPDAAYHISGSSKKPAHALYTGSLSRALQFLDLGGNAAIKNMSSKNDFINLIRDGVQKKSLDSLCVVMGYSPTEIADVLHTTDRTLRRYTSAQKLNPEQSERLIELARLYARGEEVFEGLENFKTWMAAPVGALGNKKPKEFLDTSIGIDLLLEELGRIEYGIFA